MGPRRRGQCDVVRGHDHVRPSVLAQEERGREVDGIERSQLRRQRLRGPGEDGRGHLDQLDALEEPEDALPPARSA